MCRCRCRQVQVHVHVHVHVYMYIYMQNHVHQDANTVAIPQQTPIVTSQLRAKSQLQHIAGYHPFAFGTGHVGQNKTDASPRPRLKDCGKAH
jgi:hypothetical protein